MDYTILKPKFKKSDKVTLAQNGDKEAFSDLINEHKLELYKLGKSVLSDDNDIADENGVIIQGYSGLSGSNDTTKLEIKYKFYGFVEKMPKEFNFIPVKVNPLNDEYEVGTKIDISNIPKITVKCDSNN